MSRGPTARLFVALDLPAEVRETLGEWAREVARARGRGGAGGHGELRALDPHGLHLTLCFLGARPVGEIDLLASALAPCADHACELSSARRCGCLPASRACSRSRRAMRAVSSSACSASSAGRCASCATGSRSAGASGPTSRSRASAGGPRAGASKGWPRGPHQRRAGERERGGSADHAFAQLHPGVGHAVPLLAAALRGGVRGARQQRARTRLKSAPRSLFSVRGAG